MKKLGTLLVTAAVLFCACKPEFSDRTSEVMNYRVLAVQSEPAEWTRVLDPDTGEAKPAKFHALVVNPVGTVVDAPLDWAFCTLPKPLTELNDVNIACFRDDASYTLPLGTAPEVTAALPENACRQFGPDIPEDQAFRPADPDTSGGYYQPLRIFYRPTPALTVPALAKMRIRCGLPGASPEQVTRYNRNYHLNTNPSIDSVTVNGTPLVPRETDPNAVFPVPHGAKITFRVTWPVCPLVDACGDGVCGPTETKETGGGNCEADCKVEKGCGGAERYLSFSLETRQVTEVREVMRVSWYAARNGGDFADDRTGRAASDLANFAENEYTVPNVAGDFPIWTVLRDDRGGAFWRSFVVRVQ